MVCHKLRARNCYPQALWKQIVINPTCSLNFRPHLLDSPYYARRWIGCLSQPVGPILRPPGSLRNWSPPLDVYEDKDCFTVLLDLPGLKRQDIEITLREQNLAISGERRAEGNKGEQGFRAERFYGGFQRTVKLPAQVDPNNVKASYQDGVLKVVLSKAEAAKPKQIGVSVD
jgi:HSP20 family protein